MFSNEDDSMTVDLQHGVRCHDLKSMHRAEITKQPPGHQSMRYSSESTNGSHSSSQKMFTTAPLLSTEDAWMEIKLLRVNGPIPRSIMVTVSTCYVNPHGRDGLKQFLPHPFHLTGQGTLDGVYHREHCGIQKVGIHKLKIERCPKAKVESNLRGKIGYDFTGQLKEILETGDRTQLKTNLNGVRLCICLKLIFSDGSQLILDPLYSNPIMDDSKPPKEKKIVIEKIHRPFAPTNKRTQVAVSGKRFQIGDAIIFSEEKTGWVAEVGVTEDVWRGPKNLNILTPIYDGPSQSERIRVDMFVRPVTASGRIESDHVPFTFYNEYSIFATRESKKLKCETENKIFSVATRRDAIYSRGVTAGTDTYGIIERRARKQSLNFLTASNSSFMIPPVKKTQVDRESGQTTSTSQPGTEKCWRDPAVGHTTISSPGDYHCKDIQGPSGSDDKEHGVKQPFTIFPGVAYYTKQICKNSEFRLPVEKNVNQNSGEKYMGQFVAMSNAVFDRGRENISLSTSSAHSQHVTQLVDLGENQNNHNERSIVDQSDGAGQSLLDDLVDFILEYDKGKTIARPGPFDNTLEQHFNFWGISSQGPDVNPPANNTQHEPLDNTPTLGQLNEHTTDQSNTFFGGTSLSTELVEWSSNPYLSDSVQIPAENEQINTDYGPTSEPVEFDLSVIQDDQMNRLFQIVDSMGLTELETEQTD